MLAIVEYKAAWKRDPSGQFEKLAEQFYRETGLLAPGKSVPVEMYQDEAERRQRWDEFTARLSAERDETIREAAAALPAPQGEEAAICELLQAVSARTSERDQARAAIEMLEQAQVEDAREIARLKALCAKEGAGEDAPLGHPHPPEHACDWRCESAAALPDRREAYIQRVRETTQQIADRIGSADVAVTSSSSLRSGVGGAKQLDVATHGAKFDLTRRISGALKSAIDAHGTITLENRSQAAKRIAGALYPIHENVQGRIARAMESMESGATEQQRRDAWNDLRDLFFPVGGASDGDKEAIDRILDTWRDESPIGTALVTGYRQSLALVLRQAYDAGRATRDARASSTDAGVQE